MKKIIRYFSIISLLIIICQSYGFSQKKVEKYFVNFSNDVVTFEIIKRGVSHLLDSNKIQLSTYEVAVTSIDINYILKKTSKEKVIGYLVKSLNDTTKDWYANLLLHQITKRDGSAFLAIDNRVLWVERMKEADTKYWYKFFKLK